MPLEHCQNRCNSSLICLSEPVDRGATRRLLTGWHEVGALGFEGERADRDLGDGRARFTLQELGDRLLPCVGLEAGGLFVSDTLLLESAIGPPRHASPKQVDGLSEELIAISAQGIEVDLTDLERPDSSGAGFIGEV